MLSQTILVEAEIIQMFASSRNCGVHDVSVLISVAER